MKLISAVTALILSANVTVSYGQNVPKSKRDVTLTISSSKTEFAENEPVMVDITLSNNESNKPARILDWVDPCDTKDQSDGLPKEMSFFNIDTSGGYKAKYLGALFKRGKPTQSNYKLLMPGEQISCAIDIDAFYKFDSPSDDDNYEIKYSVTGLQLSGPENNGNAVESLESNTLMVKVKARAPPADDLFSRNLRGLQTTSFNGCSSARQSDINQARSHALNAATDAANLIDTVSGSGCTRYEEWFGAYSSSRHSELKSGYDTIRARLNDANIRFDCTCTSGYYAYVYPNSPYNIYLCNAFWSAGMTGTDSKMGTMVHEMSHFAVTADTDDNAYGQSACRTLADSNPGAAINNGDSHEYMAENTPSLTCTPAPAPSSGSSCMSGSTRVGIQDELAKEPQYKSVRDLSIGDTIQGLDENMDPMTCSVEAIGHYGTGPTYGNYTEDHFILDTNANVVLPNGEAGEKEVVDKYSVLTSCPVGIDESGTGFTPVDGDFLGHEALAWADYVVIHQAIVDIVREVGPFVFSPSTYKSMEMVKGYTNKLYKTMLKCAKNAKTCNQFEKAAMDLVENSLTNEAKEKVNAGFANFGKADKPGSISAAVSKGKSVNNGGGKPNNGGGKLDYDAVLGTADADESYIEIEVKELAGKVADLEEDNVEIMKEIDEILDSTIENRGN